MKEQIENNFKHHAPTPEQMLVYGEVRNKAKELALCLDGVVPNSREKSLAITHLEEAVMWSNAAIARNKKIGDK